MTKIGRILVLLVLAASAVTYLTWPNSADAAPLPATATVSTSTSRVIPSMCAEITLTINSSAGVGAAQVIFDIPSDLVPVNPQSPQATGFLASPTYLKQGTEHRWFNLQANGNTSATFQVLFNIASGTALGTQYNVVLNGISLKNTAGATITVQGTLPISLPLRVEKADVAIIFVTLDNYFSSQPTGITCNAVPTTTDIFKLLDSYFQ